MHVTLCLQELCRQWCVSKARVYLADVVVPQFWASLTVFQDRYRSGFTVELPPWTIDTMVAAAEQTQQALANVLMVVSSVCSALGTSVCNH
jgi:hypothetical protein